MNQQINPKNEWKDMNDFKDSWGPLTEAIHKSLDEHLRDDQYFELHWRSNGSWGFEIRIQVINVD